MLDKIFGTKWRNPEKMDKTRIICYVLLRDSWLLLPSLISEWETGHYAMFLPEFERFLIFGNSWGN